MDAIIRAMQPRPMTNWQYRQMLQALPVASPTTDIPGPPLKDNGSSLKAAYVQQVQLQQRMIAPSIMAHRA